MIFSLRRNLEILMTSKWLISKSMFFVVAIVIAGCNQVQNRTEQAELSQWIGENVRVQFRRDALGAAANLPISPKTGEINGASTTLVGTLLNVYSTSIIIEENTRQKWIPREVILYIEKNP